MVFSLMANSLGNLLSVNHQINYRKKNFNHYQTEYKKLTLAGRLLINHLFRELIRKMTLK